MIGFRGDFEQLLVRNLGTILQGYTTKEDFSGEGYVYLMYVDAQTAEALRKAGLSEQSADRVSSPAWPASPPIMVLGQLLLLPRAEWARLRHEASS